MVLEEFKLHGGTVLMKNGKPNWTATKKREHQLNLEYYENERKACGGYQEVDVGNIDVRGLDVTTLIKNLRKLPKNTTVNAYGGELAIIGRVRYTKEDVENDAKQSTRDAMSTMKSNWKLTGESIYKRKQKESLLKEKEERKLLKELSNKYK